MGHKTGTMATMTEPYCEDTTHEIMDAVLRAHMHRQQAELLASQEALDVTRYMPSQRMDKAEVALLALLQRYRSDLYEQRVAIMLEHHAPDDELFVELGRYEIPLPTNWRELEFQGFRLKVVDNQFPPRVTWVRKPDQERQAAHERVCFTCWKKRCDHLVRRGLNATLARELYIGGPSASMEQMRILEAASADVLRRINAEYVKLNEQAKRGES